MRRVLLALLLSSWATACGVPEKRSLLEDQTRRVAPLPACVLHLPERRVESAGTMRHLRETEIVHLIFPSFDPDKRQLPHDAAVCTGADLLGAPPLSSGAPVRGGAWPWTERDGDLLYGSGGDRIKIVWLRMLTFDDGTAGGPLAIVRGTERFAELFAVGSLRAHAERVSLGTHRMGGDLLVTAEDDGCSGRKQGQPCETVMTVLLPRTGVLRRVVDVPLERVAYGGQDPSGTEGPLEYHLTSNADYRDDGIHIQEQVRVKDQSGNELHRLERERVFVMDASGTMTTNDPPLWDTAVKLAAPVNVEKRGTPPGRGRAPRRP